MSTKPRWQRLLLEAGVSVEHTLEDLKHRFKRRIGYTDPIVVRPYHSYGTTRRVFLFARVLEDEGATEPSAEDTPWQNFVRSFKLFESDEIPGARVRIRFDGQAHEVQSDREGYIRLELDGTFEPGQHEVTFELLEPRVERPDALPARGSVFIPRPDSQFTVISDIDDTVMHTEATSLLRMAINSVFSNAHTRVAFPGVAEFYAALHRKDGRDEGGLNPFFYLTSGPWNVYDLIRLFLELHDIPAGPILMRDLGLSSSHFLHGSHDEHKRSHIRELIDLYPDQRFILVGDTGQRDAEIYSQICREASDHILAVYLRSVGDDAREHAVGEIVAGVEALGIPAVAAPDTKALAAHALGNRWITQADFEAVVAASNRDQADDAADAPGDAVADRAE